MTSGQAYSKNSRPQNIVYSGLLAAAAAYLSGAGIVAGLICYAVVLLLYALATTYNNYRDIETDRLNKREDNPLVSGKLKAQDLRPFVISAAIGVGLCLIVLREPASLAVAVVYLLLAVAYSHPRLKVMSRGLWAIIVLAVCYGGLPLLLGALQRDWLSPVQLVALSLLQIGLLAPVLLAKDYKDEAGDAATGKLTPLVRHGRRYVVHLALGIAVAVAGGLIALNWILRVSDWYFVAPTAIYLVLVYWLHRSGGKMNRPMRLVLMGSILAIVMLLMVNM